MGDSSVKVLVTGASGLLGRQIMAEFSSLPSFSPVGLCFSRPGPNLTKLDLTDESATARFLNELKPEIVIHASAQRFPDKVEKDPKAALELNVVVSRSLAALCKKLKARLIYISTDYVFDGTAAPYSHLASPKPANRYGETKLASLVWACPRPEGERSHSASGRVEEPGKTCFTFQLRGAMSCPHRRHRQDPGRHGGQT